MAEKPKASLSPRSGRETGQARPEKRTDADRKDTLQDPGIPQGIVLSEAVVFFARRSSGLCVEIHVIDDVAVYTGQRSFIGLLTHHASRFLHRISACRENMIF